MGFDKNLNACRGKTCKNVVHGRPALRVKVSFRAVHNYKMVLLLHCSLTVSPEVPSFVKGPLRGTRRFAPPERIVWASKRSGCRLVDLPAALNPVSTVSGASGSDNAGKHFRFSILRLVNI